MPWPSEHHICRMYNQPFARRCHDHAPCRGRRRIGGSHSELASWWSSGTVGVWGPQLDLTSSPFWMRIAHLIWLKGWPCPLFYSFFIICLITQLIGLRLFRFFIYLCTSPNLTCLNVVITSTLFPGVLLQVYFPSGRITRILWARIRILWVPLHVRQLDQIYILFIFLNSVYLPP